MLVRFLPLLFLGILACGCATTQYAQGPSAHPVPPSFLSQAPAATRLASGGLTQSLSRDEWGHRPGPKGFRTVIIDAGHGGRDPGASSRSGLREKELALDTAQRLAAKLRGSFEVILIRGDDRFVDLDRRVQLASQRDGAVLVSIHYNWSANSAIRGPETYYWRVDSFGIGKRIQQNLERTIPDDRGHRGLVRRRLRLTRNPNVPSVLVELGYLSNAAEAQLCTSAVYRDRLAGALANALISQQRNGDAGMGARPQPLNEPPSRPTDPPGS